MLCATYDDLLEKVCAASALHYQATVRLMALVGKGKDALFIGAKHECEASLADCKCATAALHVHKATHGCKLP